MVICLKRGTDLHMAQLMPLSLASAKSRLVFTFLAPAHPGSPGQRAIKRVSVCLIRHASFVRYFLKVCRLYAHQYAAEIRENPLSYIFYGVSLAG